MIPFSILDLCPVPEGKTPADAFRYSLELAQLGEAHGYNRIWLAEHHNMPGIASAATAVVMGHIAAHTKTIRVGSGGVMLPNHSPLVIAEQFGTLASLYPCRIDLGLGRAPGTDMLTARALRRNNDGSAERFPQDVQELLHYFEAAEPDQRLRAIPGAGLDVPVWLLGSSLYSARLAAMLGLPFAFASHFAPSDLQQAVALYRQEFQPSKYLANSYAMAGVNIVAADSGQEARYHFTSIQQSFTNLRRGVFGKIPCPIDDIEIYWSPQEKASTSAALSCSFVGTSETVSQSLQSFIDTVQPDELMITANIHDHEARLNSYKLASQLRVHLKIPENFANTF